MSVTVATVADKGYRLVTAGLVIDRSLSLDEWLALGRNLQASVNRLQWAIGDWLAYGAGRGEYGATYEHAAIITGRSYETLGQYLRVSNEFQAAERDAPVSWSFYREALRLPVVERLRTLHLAAENRWTRDDMADYIASRGSVPLSTRKQVSDRGDAVKTWQRNKRHRYMITCPECGHEWEQARQRVGRPREQKSPPTPRRALR